VKRRFLSTQEAMMGETIDKVSIATAAGHGAAVNLLLAMAALSVNPPKEFDANCWPAFGLARIQDEDRDPPLELGRYVCGRPDPVQPETLFRKAAELGLHGAGADSWNAAGDGVRLAYTLFADVAGRVFRELSAYESRARAAPPAPPPPRLEETIFEPIEDSGAMDADRVASLAPQKPKPETDAGLTAPLRVGVADGDPLVPAPEAPMSVGEKPVDTARQAKKPHGGRRTKGGAAS